MHPVEGLKGNRRSGFILLSGRMCNYDCPHCLTDSGSGKREFAKPLMAEKILRNIKPVFEKESVSFIAVSGGEPFLNLDFIEGVIKELRNICSEIHIPLPKIPIVTNGTVSGLEIFDILEPVKDRIMIYYSPDEFHPKPSGIPMFEMYGFHIDSPGAERKIAALGRAYHMEGDYNWKTDCDAAGLTYRVENGSILSFERKVTTKKFMVLENGDIKLCGWGGLSFGNLEKENVFDIAERIEKDERALALMEGGPLGLAEVLGKAKEAAEVFMKRGSCAVCHALKEGLI